MRIRETSKLEPSRDAWLTTTEAAKLLFGGMAVRTLQVWAKKGKVPAVQTPGGTWRFLRSDIEEISQIQGRE